MVKHLTWCLKRTLLLTSRLNVYKQPTLTANNLTIQCRYIVNQRAKQINIDYDEPKDYLEFVSDQRNSQLQAVNMLRKVLSVARENAKKAVNNYPKFALLTKKTIYNNFETLRQAGFYKSTIKDNKYLLTDDTSTLKMKIKAVEKICTDINDAASLFQLHHRQLANFEYQLKTDSKYLPARNRLYYLAKKLQCDIGTICEVMIYNPYLMKQPARKLLAITEYILETGISPENILNDLWIFNYKIDTIKNSLERAKKAGICPIKPWIVRCPEDVWEKIEKRQTERASILKPGQSVPEYLREIFDCDIESVNYFIEKNPKLLTMNLEKLTTMVKFLHNEGYKIEDFMRSPVIGRKLTLVLERYHTWKKACSRLPPLSILNQTQDMFEKALQAEREHYNALLAKNDEEKPS